MELEEIYSSFALMREAIFRGRIKSFYFGEHKSRAISQGVDFHEINEWDKNEPIGRINWSLSIADWPDKAYKVEMIDPRHTPLVLLADISPSVLVQVDSRANKTRLLLELLGMLGFSAEYLKDPVGICAFSDKIEFYLPCRLGRGNLFHGIRLVFDKIQDLKETYGNKKVAAAHSGTDLNQAVNFIGSRIKRQCSVVILSDFSDIISGRSELDFQSLKSLAAKHAWNVIALFLDDPEELSWGRAGGLVRVKDAETGELQTVKANKAPEIRQTFVQKLEELREKLENIGVSSTVLNHGKHIEQLIQFLSARASRYQ